MPSQVHVRMLVPIGGHQAGDLVWLTDRQLTADQSRGDEPQTLIESYVAAGYVELVTE